MTILASGPAGSEPQIGPRSLVAPAPAQAVLLLVLCASIVAGAMLTGESAMTLAVSQAGADLARLLRLMAALKAVMALGAATAVFWRLGSTITRPWLAAYAAACGAMGAGPGLIYGMAHVGMGALLLHGGLAASAVLLWRDPVVTERLARTLAARRAKLRARTSGIIEGGAGAPPRRSAPGPALATTGEDI